MTQLKSVRTQTDRGEGIRLFTVQEAAARMGVSVHYIYRAIDAGKLPYVDLGNGRAKIRVRSDHFAELVERLTHRAELKAVS